MVTEKKKNKQKTKDRGKVQRNALGTKPNHKASKVQKGKLKKGS